MYTILRAHSCILFKRVLILKPKKPRKTLIIRFLWLIFIYEKMRTRALSFWLVLAGPYSQYPFSKILWFTRIPLTADIHLLQIKNKNIGLTYFISIRRVKSYAVSSTITLRWMMISGSSSHHRQYFHSNIFLIYCKSW